MSAIKVNTGGLPIYRQSIDFRERLTMMKAANLTQESNENTTRFFQCKKRLRAR
jgi:hypothetical protein